MCLYAFKLLYRKITSTTVWECEKLCLLRWLTAMALTMLSQFVWIIVFLFSINYHLLHWFALDTWISLMPLMSAIILYADFLAIYHMSAKHYYGTRFNWLVATTLQKCFFLAFHISIGFLTARLYVRHLHVDFNEERHINTKYLFLVGAGIFTGFYDWIDESLKPVHILRTPVNPVSLQRRISHQINLTLRKSLRQSFNRTLIYIGVFLLVGDMINRQMARHYALEADTTSIWLSLSTNIRLLLFSWILSWQIICTMQLMGKFFSILFYTQVPFPIVKRQKVTLEEALGMREVPVIQYLAAYELNFIALYSKYKRFQLLFALTMPSAIPQNLNQLTARCITVINAFREELTRSIKNIPPTMKSSPRYQNQALSYMFDEPDGGKTAFLISEAHTIIWVCLGLAAICAAAKIQNKNDIIKTAEPRIKRALFELNGVLVKLNQINLNCYRVDSNLKRLQNTVKISLKRIDAPVEPEMHDDESSNYD